MTAASERMELAHAWNGLLRTVPLQGEVLDLEDFRAMLRREADNPDMKCPRGLIEQVCRPAAVRVRRRMVTRADGVKVLRKSTIIRWNDAQPCPV